MDNPERIQRKGRPPKPVRMKTHIEEIKKKMVAAEKKKKKKTNDTESVGYKEAQKKIQFIQIQFKSKYKNSYLCELIMSCRLPDEAKKKEEEGNNKW